MNKTTEFMQAFGAAWTEMFRQREVKIGIAMGKWARNFHRPIDGLDNLAGLPPCYHCGEDWPCSEFARISEHIYNLESELTA